MKLVMTFTLSHNNQLHHQSLDKGTCAYCIYIFLLSGSNMLPTFFCKKAVVMHLHTRPDMCAFHAFKKLALISKTNENLKLLKPCYSNLHNNYNIAKKVGEDSKTNPCQLNKYNSAYCKNSCGFFLIESGLHILSRYLITTVVHKTS